MLKTYLKVYHVLIIECIIHYHIDNDNIITVSMHHNVS